jgi:large subunit ribosomal protein L3
MAWILAHKLEMTRIVKWNEFVPITLLKVPTVKIIAVKTEETDGYNSIVLWILREGKEGKLKDGRKTLSLNEFSRIKELIVDSSDLEKFNAGDDVTLDALEWIEKVSFYSFSKWRWFAWAMKRHNFHGWLKTHGSKFHRALGSIGNRKPTRTHKGKKMHGHYWNVKISLRDVPLELINKDLWVIGVKWPIPGWRNSLVVINF